MLHTRRKTVIDNNNDYIIEKRVKKTENDLKHLNEDVRKLEDAVFLLTAGDGLPGGGGNGGLFPGLDDLPGLGDLDSLPGLDELEDLFISEKSKSKRVNTSKALKLAKKIHEPDSKKSLKFHKKGDDGMGEIYAGFILEGRISYKETAYVFYLKFPTQAEYLLSTIDHILLLEGRKSLILKKAELEKVKALADKNRPN